MLSIPELDPATGTLGAALAYAAAGIYVLPVARRNPKPGKNPGSVVGDDWNDKSSRDPAQIAAWFAGTDHGIALHCGRSGLVVFDVDDFDKVPEVLLKHLPTAPYQATRPDQPDRGHYIFQQPPGRSIGNSGGGLGGAWGEVRGLNGVIIAEPSWHPEGGEYHWQRTAEIPVLPDDIADMLNDATPGKDAATDEQVIAFINEHTAATRPDVIPGLKKALTDNIKAKKSRHQSAVSAVTVAMKEARAGSCSAQAAIDTLKPIFINAVQRGDNRRTENQAENEWDGILAWAIGQAQAPDPTDIGPGPQPEPVTPITLGNAHKVFKKWLGNDYDTDALDATLVTVAVERLDGDPLWLLLVSGSGNAKTETVQSTSGTGAQVTSALASEAALLSATPKKERAKDATGGLLRRIGDRGVLVIKDVTSILSMDRNIRARVLAALREVYDGHWVREVGAEGGRCIEWKGRIAVVGAVTTAWDTAHSVIASMGDRFVLIRVDSTTARQAAGRKAIGNTGDETTMRAELAAAAAGVIAGMNTKPITITDDETDLLLAAADLVTLSRTAVEYDYAGNVIDAHAPEMPTRFAKQLAQVMRGAVAIGMDRGDALRLAIRCARDSMPPLRLAIIEEVAKHPHSTPTEVRKELGKPRTTVDRQLQALHILGVVELDEVETTGFGGKTQTHWHYSLADGIDPAVLASPDLLLDTPYPKEESEREQGGDEDSLQGVTHKSGDGPQAHHTSAVTEVTTTEPVRPANHGHFTPDPPCFHCDRPVAGKQKDKAGRFAHFDCQSKASARQVIR